MYLFLALMTVPEARTLNIFEQWKSIKNFTWGRGVTWTWTDLDRLAVSTCTSGRHCINFSRILKPYTAAFSELNDTRERDLSDTVATLLFRAFPHQYLHIFHASSIVFSQPRTGSAGEVYGWERKSPGAASQPGICIAAYSTHSFYKLGIKTYKHINETA